MAETWQRDRHPVQDGSLLCQHDLVGNSCPKEGHLSCLYTRSRTTKQVCNRALLDEIQFHQDAALGATAFRHVGEAPPPADRRTHRFDGGCDNNAPEYL